MMREPQVPVGFQSTLGGPLHVVRRSGIEGLGLFALRDIPAGAYLGRYGGARFSGYAAWRRAGRADGRYLFGLPGGGFIDGIRSKFGRLNHSCDPNAVVRTELVNSRHEVRFYAARPIAAGSEISIDYQLQPAPGEAPDLNTNQCACGSRRCRGWLFAAEYLPRKAA